MKLTLVSVSIVAIVAVFAIAILSCAPKKRTAPSTRTLLLVNEIINHGGRKCTSTIRVHHDGSYVFERRDPFFERNQPKRFEGQLPPILLSELGELVHSSDLGYTNGSATYDFYPDNSYITPPPVILRLFEAVTN